MPKLCKAFFSFRRGKTESGDIDALITHPEITLKQKGNKNEKYTLENIVKKLEGLVIDTLSVGETKFMVSTVSR